MILMLNVAETRDSRDTGGRKIAVWPAIFSTRINTKISSLAPFGKSLDRQLPNTNPAVLHGHDCASQYDALNVGEHGLQHCVDPLDAR